MEPIMDNVTQVMNLERPQTLGEEIANSITHGVGFVAAVVGAPFLIFAAAHHGNAQTIVAVSIFAASMMLLYLCSMTYHFLPHGGGAKRLFDLLDHCAIYLLIAGTYTPFALSVLSGATGWILFGLIWSAALLGIVTTLVPMLRITKVQLGLYLAMGWVIVFFIRPLCQHLPFDGLLWLVAGGLAYTVGVIFYSITKPKYFHFIWHIFTVAGTACHFFAVLWYVT
jgi:hemolysin III